MARLIFRWGLFPHVIIGSKTPNCISSMHPESSNFPFSCVRSHHSPDHTRRTSSGVCVYTPRTNTNSTCFRSPPSLCSWVVGSGYNFGHMSTLAIPQSCGFSKKLRLRKHRWRRPRHKWYKSKCFHNISSVCTRLSIHVYIRDIFSRNRKPLRGFVNIKYSNEKKLGCWHIMDPVAIK